jgi:hypothetical protein
VNDLPGVTTDTIAAARNSLVLYNVSPTCAFQMTEIATLAKFGLIDSDRTDFYRYDIGEPEITWLDATGSTRTLTGMIVPFGANRLALARVEMRDDSGLENWYDREDGTRRTIDTDLADGVNLRTDQTLSVFGVVKPIPTSITSGTYSNQFVAENRIASLAVVVRDSMDAAVEVSTRTVGLERVYVAAAPDWVSPSIYEFRHEYRFDQAGAYTIECTALDTLGAPVSGTSATLHVRVDSAAPRRREAGGWRLY